MKKFAIVIFISLITVNFTAANVPAPPPIKGYGIELENSYKDYNFYFGENFSFSESVDVNYQASGKQIEFFEIEQINLTKEKPFVIESPNAFNIKTLKEKIPQDEKVYYPKKVNYLIAVEKDVQAGMKGDSKKKILTLIGQKSNENGIYYAVIPDFGVKCDDFPPCILGSYTNVVRVESLDQNGLKFKDFDNDGHWIGKEPERPKETKTKTCFGVTLSVLGISFGVIFFHRRRMK